MSLSPFETSHLTLFGKVTLPTFTRIVSQGLAAASLGHRTVALSARLLRPFS